MSASKVLVGRHARVTGGSRGIGLETAKRLAQMGARSTIMGRDAVALALAADDLARYGEVHTVTGDVSQADEVQCAFGQARQRFGPIDILVNNAGQAISQPFERPDAAAWQQMLAVNLSGVFHCMQAALPRSEERRVGEEVVSMCRLR